MPIELERLSRMLRRRLFVIIAVCICGVVAAPFLPSVIHASYVATAQLLVVSEIPKDTSQVSADLPSIAQSSAVLERVKHDLSISPDLDLRDRVRAKVLPRSSIMQITYRDRESERAATIANAIADETVVYYHEIATRRYDDVTRQLSQTITQLRSQIDAVNGRLQRVYPYANSDRAGEDLSTRVDALRSQRDQAYADLVSDRATDRAFAEQGPKIAGIVKQEVLQHDPSYTDIQEQLAGDEATLASQRATYTSAYPAVAALSEKVALERKQLKAIEEASLRSRSGSSPSYASNVLDQRKSASKTAGDEARVRALDAELVDAERHLRDTFGPGASVAALRAERDAAQQQYLTLTQRLSTAQADAAQAASLGTLVVVDRAIPSKAQWQLLFAYFPLFYSLFICALAIAAAFALESMDRRFWEATDLEDVYGRPVFEIGEI